MDYDDLWAEGGNLSGSINNIPVALYELYNNDLDANGSVQRRTINLYEPQVNSMTLILTSILLFNLAYKEDIV